MPRKDRDIHTLMTQHEFARLERARQHQDRTRSDFIRLAVLRACAIVEGEMLASGAIGLDPVEPDAVQAVIP